MIALPIIHENVSKHFNIGLIEVFERTNKSEVVYPRQIFHYLSRTLNNPRRASFGYIGNYYSDVCKPYLHCAVMHSVKKIEGYLTYDSQVRKDVEAITLMVHEQVKLEKEKEALMNIEVVVTIDEEIKKESLKEAS